MAKTVRNPLDFKTISNTFKKLTPERPVKIYNNTYLKEIPPARFGDYDEPGFYRIVLHSTPILTYHQDGRIVLNSGGHRTVTTKARLNTYLPDGFYVFQKGHAWYLHTPNDGEVFFEDLMTIDIYRRVKR